MDMHPSKQVPVFDIDSVRQEPDWSVALAGPVDGQDVEHASKIRSRVSISGDTIVPRNNEPHSSEYFVDPNASTTSTSKLRKIARTVYSRLVK